MALNVVLAGTPENNREVPVAANTVAGTPLIALGRPAVTLTARGDVVNSKGVKIGGIGNKADSATVAFNGVYIFPVTGALANTAKGTKVYLTSAGALTLTEGTNTLFGTVYDNKPSAAKCAVEIGA